MYRSLSAIPLLLISLIVSASDLGVSITVGQPGFYGQITLGSHYPVPKLIYQNPRVVIPPAVPVQQQPIYLHVPPGHAKKWSKHCHRYNACQLPVYFVQEDWYNNVYVPQYASQHQHDRYQQGDDSDYVHHNNRNKFDHDGDDHHGRGKSKLHDSGNHEGKGKKDHERGNSRRD